MAGIQIDGVNNKIDFDDDADTSISSATDDTLVIEAGGVNIASITAGEFAINEGSADIDFRVESNGNANMLVVDGGDDDIRVGTATSFGSNDTGLKINGGLTLGDFTADTGSRQLHFIKSRNTTVGSQTIVNNGDSVGGIFWKADDGNDSTYNNNVAGIEAFVDAAPGTDDTGGRLIFYTTADGARTNSERIRITSAGKVGIGTNDPDMLLDITGTVDAGGGSDEKLQQWNINSDNVKAEIEYLDTSSERGYAIGTSSQHHFMLRTNDAIRVKVNETGGLILTHPLNSVYAIDNQITPSSGNVYGQKNTFENHSPDNNTSSFYWGNDNVTARFGVYSDGDVQNHDNSYGAFSDERIKQNIRDANSQWDDIKAVKVRNFKKKDDVRQYGDKAWEQIGVIAQELEAAGMDKLIKHGDPSAGDIASSSEFGTLYEDGDDIPEGKKIGDIKEIKAQVKKIGYSVLYMKAIKALQEAMAKIETLETKVKALEDA